MIPNNIRDLRERKLLSQDAVAKAAGISWSQFCRIEAGRGKTTQEEIDKVLRALDKMKPGTRKLSGGRPYSDPAKQSAVEAARLTGASVAEALAATAPDATAAPVVKKAPAAKKTTAKKTPAAKKTTVKKTTAKRTRARATTKK